MQKDKQHEAFGEVEREVSEEDMFNGKLTKLE